MAVKLIPNALPYCEWRVSGDGRHVYPRCSEAYWPIAEENQYEHCPMCERPIKRMWLGAAKD